MYSGSLRESEALQRVSGGINRNVFCLIAIRLGSSDVLVL